MKMTLHRFGQKIRILHPSTSEILKLFNEFHRDVMFCDLYFICADGVYVPSVRLVWAALSEFFHELFDVVPEQDIFYVTIPNLASTDMILFLKELFQRNLVRSQTTEETFKYLCIDVNEYKTDDFEWGSSQHCPTTDPSCQKPVQSSRKLIKERKTKERSEAETCSKCGKTISSRIGMLAHKKWHENESSEQQYSCTDCKKGFKTRHELKQHFDRKHGNLSRTFSCSVNGCDKSFKSNGELKVHLRSHSVIKDFICTECGLPFRTKKTLELHVLRKHSQLKETIPCQECGKMFKLREDLRSHFHNAHKALRKNLCTICGKSFTQKSTLRVHMMMHNDERPEQCGTCGIRFRTVTGLRKHEKTHSNVKDFPCPHCPKAFGRNDHLKNHLKSHRSTDIVYRDDSTSLVLLAPAPSHETTNTIVETSNNGIRDIQTSNIVTLIQSNNTD